MTEAVRLVCRDEQRRGQVRRAGLNGLDFVEVSDDQLTLTATFLGQAPEWLGKGNVRIDGGRRVKGLEVVDLRLCRQDDPTRDDCLRIVVDRVGDFSTYTLRLVKPDEHGRPGDEPLGRAEGFDPRYTSLDFSFKVNCPSDLDCDRAAPGPPPALDEPDISYLARDYASFRRLILDRLALIMPAWKERHVPDLGIALVELLAYLGDYLSYYQDAVATEAYLDTARRRVSVRRHARLIDYPMHDGCNARAFVCVEVAEPLSLAPDEFYLLTDASDRLPLSGAALLHDDLRRVPADAYEVFEPLVDGPVEPRPGHNRISFWTWGDQECCLPRGVTSATLRDGEGDATPPDSKEPAKQEQSPASSQQLTQKSPDEPKPSEPERVLELKVGDVLIFEELLGPLTGAEADADPNHRQAVRLTKVEPGVDDLYGQPIVEIEWAPEDALRFPLCLSAVGGKYCTLNEVSVARGNVVLVDHGRTLTRCGEPAEEWPVPDTAKEPAGCERIGEPREPRVKLPRFGPTLEHGPVTQRAPGPPPSGPARDALRQEPRDALPVVSLRFRRAEESGGAGWEADETAVVWVPRRDLLASHGRDRHFVAEIDDDGRAQLRFGDGQLGQAVAPGATLLADYRVGNGAAGNVGAEAITRIVFCSVRPAGIVKVRNLLPAEGGTDPEPLAEVKLFGPAAVRQRLLRAVTADDYARLAEQVEGVQRAAGYLSWNGGWHEVRVAVDPLGGRRDERLLAAVEAALGPYRRIGHDVAVRWAEEVPLDVVLQICVEPHALRAHVLAELLDLFSNRVLPDGRRGLFHPDNLTFGDDVHLSKLVAAAQAVPGVESVALTPATTRLQRLFEADEGAVETGVLPLGPLEVARLDNDPGQPELGRLKFELRGGR